MDMMSRSRDRIVQITEGQSSADIGDIRIPQRPYRLGDPLPAQLDPAWMQWIFGMKSSKFFALKKRGFFDRFELLPRSGWVRWSSVLVEEHFRTGGRSSFSFGRKRTA
jgi:hypothetical protein